VRVTDQNSGGCSGFRLSMVQCSLRAIQNLLTAIRIYSKPSTLLREAKTLSSLLHTKSQYLIYMALCLPR